MDFWMGEWEIRSGARTVGVSTIQAALGGCALVEKGSMNAGDTFISIAFYDPATGKWYRNVHTNPGLVFESSGEFKGGVGHLSGMRPEYHRSTLTPHSMHEARDLVETSADGGATWTVFHDLVYVRRK
jgi:hypothetical protein